MPPPQSQALLPTPDPINPDGVPITVFWHELVVGASIFIPAINMTKLIKQMYTEAKLKEMRLVGRERSEGGKIGVRFWRVV